MNKILRISMFWLAGFALVLSGCNGVLPIPPTPTALVLNPPVVLPASATPQVQEVSTATPLPVALSFAALDGLVWEDQDRDGVQAFEETGVPNVTVSLLTGARMLAGTTVTDANGAYRFQDLVPGDYFVNLQLPPGSVFSPLDQGMNDLVDSDTDPASSDTIPVTLQAGENGLVFTTGISLPTTTLQAGSGTVKPPPARINVCVPGTYSLGGISTVQIDRLAAGYCVYAYLWNHGFAIGRIPGGAGRILSDVTFVEYFSQGNFVYDAPSPESSVQVCYAVPAGMQAQLYFFDHYGPRFGHPHQGQPSWVPLETIIQDGFACAAAQTSGAYALIGQ